MSRQGSKLSRDFTEGYNRASPDFLCLYCSRPRSAKHRNTSSKRPQCIECYTKAKARRAAFAAQRAGVAIEPRAECAKADAQVMAIVADLTALRGVA